MLKDELKNKFIKKLQKIIVNNKYIDTKKNFLKLYHHIILCFFSV